MRLAAGPGSQLRQVLEFQKEMASLRICEIGERLNGDESLERAKGFGRFTNPFGEIALAGRVQSMMNVDDEHAALDAVFGMNNQGSADASGGLTNRVNRWLKWFLYLNQG
jgi:hypothetical protein